MRLLWPLCLCFLQYAAAAAAPQQAFLNITGGSRNFRRILVGDAIQEYLEVNVKFNGPLYILSCDSPTAILVGAAAKCVECPPGCVLSALFGRYPWVPSLLPVKEEQPDCICGITYEEVQLRVQGLPGDDGFENMPRKPATVVGNPTVLRDFATGLWQTDSLLVTPQCTKGISQTVGLLEVRRFGLNGPPAPESLGWLRRFDTAFGIEEINRLVANISRYYDDQSATFFIPLSRTWVGTRTAVGLPVEDLLLCTLTFPLFFGPGSRPAGTVILGNLPEVTLPCSSSSLAVVANQIKAVMKQLPTAGRQDARCREYWRTSHEPGKTSTADKIPFNATRNGAAQPVVDTGRTRVRYVGILTARSDFRPPAKTDNSTVLECRSFRWQLRLRASNMRERAFMYTGTDAVNGCWEKMMKLVSFQETQVQEVTNACTKNPTSAAFLASPCCNPKLFRKSCCAISSKMVPKSVPVGINVSLAAQKCRADPSGAATYARAAIAAAISWQRRVVSGAGAHSCWAALGKAEEAHALVWQTVVRCHADVMGRYDRELQAYVGTPCITDGDCFTECVKPTLKSLQTFTSFFGQAADRQKLLVGRCRVPTAGRHKPLMKCLTRRAGVEVSKLIAKEIGLDPVDGLNLTRMTGAIAQDSLNFVPACIGPQIAAGYWPPPTRTACLAPMRCNWHPHIQTKAECLTFAGPGNTAFCGCMEGYCPQLSKRGSCISGTVLVEPCYEARNVLKKREIKCVGGAMTPTRMRRCVMQMEVHALLLRRCLTSQCLPPILSVVQDEMCTDALNTVFGTCYTQCFAPVGPNPTNGRAICYRELMQNETAADCFQTPGDAQIHYAPGGDLAPTNPSILQSQNLEFGFNELAVFRLPEERRPRYCSIRVWDQGRSVGRVRNLRKEEAALKKRQTDLAAAAQHDLATRAKANYQQVIYDLTNPFRLLGCDKGVIPVGVDSALTCKETVGVCCVLDAINTTHAVCVDCAKSNSTKCSVGDSVQAVWGGNQRKYDGTITGGKGDTLVTITWTDGNLYYRDVSWSLVWTNGKPCGADFEGCGSHSQCSPGEYCFSCEICLKINAGVSTSCGFCPSHRGGSCGQSADCLRLANSIDGRCPRVVENKCPCKPLWSVRGEYPDAPSELSIHGCYFDINLAYRWCEVVYTKGISTCPVQEIKGVRRTIYWRKCAPESCAQCNCDCTPNCRASNIIPVFGKLPDSVIPGNLSSAVPANLLSYAGTIAMNCTQGSNFRVRGLCDYCVSCCADWCHSQATPILIEDNSSNVSEYLPPPSGSTFDCTAATTAGCIDSPQGWVDTISRSCGDYASNQLCTSVGNYGMNWVYSPPKEFRDFQVFGYAANQACCDCGGGVGCKTNPNGWTDPLGHVCTDYENMGWCNRTGYGPNWDPANGTFPLGAGGVDAAVACCGCGGGVPVTQVDSVLQLVDSSVPCMQVWPNRAIWGPPPWKTRVLDSCLLFSGVCLRKPAATVYDVSLGRTLPDDPRLLGLCEQRAYRLLRPPLLEDGQILVDVVPDIPARRLSNLDQNAGRSLTNLGTVLRLNGTAIQMDFDGADGNGMCYYHLPDPFGIAGGPNRLEQPPPLIPPMVNESDQFQTPSVSYLGWPSDFWNALTNDTTPIPDITQVPGALRAFLSSEGIALALPGEYENKVNAWLTTKLNQRCWGVAGDFGKYNQERVWSMGVLDSLENCVLNRCDLDKSVVDPQLCARLSGCSDYCTFCRSPAVPSEKQGICISTLPYDVSICNISGGVGFETMLFDERKGVNVQQKVCALPFRPLQFCTRPGDIIRRCIHYDQDHCESDPIANLMRCTLSQRLCHTREECENSGRCTDADLGSSVLNQGTCVVTVLDEVLAQQGCSEDSGLCYFRTDPPFGMEIRFLHGLVDLLDPLHAVFFNGSGHYNSTVDANIDFPSDPVQEVLADSRRLRSAGRLNRTDCETLQGLAPGFSAIWIPRAGIQSECERWLGCCLLRRTDHCDLFSGEIIDGFGDAATVTRRSMQCQACGGEWGPVFQWTPGTWKEGGTMQSSERDWITRDWVPANAYVQTIDIDALRQVFENAYEARLGELRKNTAMCLVEPLMSALQMVASTCGDNKVVSDTAPTPESDLALAVAASAWSQLPSLKIPLGSVTAPSGSNSNASFGSVSISWNRFTTSYDGSALADETVYDVAMEPFDLDVAMVVPEMGRPGRMGVARDTLMIFAEYPDGTSTTLQPILQSQPTDPLALGGYPQWLVQQMIEILNPGEDAAKLAALLADAESKAKAAAVLRAQKAVLVDKSTGLRQESVDFLLRKPPPNVSMRVPYSGNQLNLDHDSCRSQLLNIAGEVIGQVLGDCVEFNSSVPMQNGIELCIPLTIGRLAGELEYLNSTVHGQVLGTVLDFAQKTRIPETYNVTLPPRVPNDGKIPGIMPPLVWGFGTHPTYGRLQPGWAQFTPLALPAFLQQGNGGLQLCSQVFQDRITYCPIIRLNTNYNLQLKFSYDNRTQAAPIPCDCPQVESVLNAIQTAQVNLRMTTARYVPMQVQIADPELMTNRSEEPPPPKVPPNTIPCSPGQCIVADGRGFQVAPVTAGSCVMQC